MRSRESKKVIYVAIATNLIIAGFKYVAAVVTKSSAMIAEAVHSSVDTGNELLLLREPALPENVGWNYGILAVAAAFEFYSWRVSYRELRSRKDP